MFDVISSWNYLCKISTHYSRFQPCLSISKSLIFTIIINFFTIFRSTNFCEVGSRPRSLYRIISQKETPILMFISMQFDVLNNSTVLEFWHKEHFCQLRAILYKNSYFSTSPFGFETTYRTQQAVDIGQILYQKMYNWMEDIIIFISVKLWKLLRSSIAYFFLVICKKWFMRSYFPLKNRIDGLSLHFPFSTLFPLRLSLKNVFVYTLCTLFFFHSLSPSLKQRRWRAKSLLVTVYFASSYFDSENCWLLEFIHTCR